MQKTFENIKQPHQTITDFENELEKQPTSTKKLRILENKSQVMEKLILSRFIGEVREDISLENRARNVRSKKNRARNVGNVT